MKIIKLAALWMLSALSIALALAVTAAPAQAQATRTWVSGVGDDANPCSRTAPCKTFAGAISKTAAAGEINCLDPGGFGGVTITKSISIVCDYTEGGILSAGAGVNGIVVNAGVNDEVFLKGLDFSGAGSAQNGIRFIAGRSLTIEHCVIQQYGAANGLGISFAPTGPSSLIVKNSIISNNGSSGGTGGGINVQPTGAGSASVLILDSTVSNNLGAGIKGTGTVFIRVGNTTVFSNTIGVSLGAGSTIGTFGNNILEANGADGGFNFNLTMH